MESSLNIATIHHNDSQTVNEAVCLWAINHPSGRIDVSRLNILLTKTLPSARPYVTWVKKTKMFDSIPKNENLLFLVCNHDLLSSKINIICWLYWSKDGEEWMPTVCDAILPAVDFKFPARYLLSDSTLYLNKHSQVYETYPRFRDFADFRKMLCKINITDCTTCMNGMSTLCNHCFRKYTQILMNGSVAISNTCRVNRDLILSTIRSLVLCYLQSKEHIAIKMATQWRSALFNDAAMREKGNHKEYLLMVPLSIAELIVFYQQMSITTGITSPHCIYVTSWILSAATIIDGLYPLTKYENVFPWDIPMSIGATKSDVCRDFLHSFNKLKEITGETLARAIVSFADELLVECDDNVAQSIAMTTRKSTSVFIPSASSSGSFTNYDIEDAYFPPCMKNLLEHRFKHNVFKNEHRYPLSSFLCHITSINNTQPLLDYWKSIAPPQYEKQIEFAYHFKVQTVSNSEKKIIHGRKAPLGCDKPANIHWCPYKGDTKKCSDKLKDKLGIQVNIVNPPSYYKALKQKYRT